MAELEKVFPLEEALKAQKALRELAGLGPEKFRVGAFVGMVSDEIEQLRTLGYSDEEIATVIAKNSVIGITAVEITAKYAAPEHRHPPND